MWRTIFCLLLILGGAVACQSDDKTASLESRSAVSTTSAPQSPAAPTPTLFEPDFGGALVYVKGESLYRHDFLGTPSPLSTSVEFETFGLTPSRQTLLFAGTRTDANLYGVTAASTTAQPIASISFHQWTPLSWSPDNRWGILRTIGGVRRLTALAGGQTYDLPARGNQPRYDWLSDGNLLIHDTNSEGQYYAVRYFNVTTGETDDWLAADDPSNTLSTVDADALVAEHGLTILPTPPQNDLYSVVPFEDVTQADACTRWGIHSTELGADVYEFGDTYALSELEALSDGRFLVLRWWMADCRLVTPPQVELLVYTPDTGTAQVIGHDVLNAFVPQRFQNLNAAVGQRRYALAPNEQAVVWSAGGIQAGYSALMLTDLTTLETHQLAYEAIEREAVFYTTQIYRAVYWLAE